MFIKKITLNDYIMNSSYQLEKTIIKEHLTNYLKHSYTIYNS